MKRNLLYNCCPLAMSDEWKLNVERLNRYGPAFNGKRLVIVRLGDEMADIGEVMQTFTFEADFLPMANDPALGETLGFIETLGKLRSHDPNEITFYAHTKGASYPPEPRESLLWMRQWRNRMYHECLSDPEMVDEVMRAHAAAGCFLRTFENHAVMSWMFAGTFYWLNHAMLFRHPEWSRLKKIDRMSVERYPGSLFPLSRAFCFFNRPFGVKKAHRVSIPADMLP